MSEFPPIAFDPSTLSMPLNPHFFAYASLPGPSRGGVPEGPSRAQEGPSNPLWGVGATTLPGRPSEPATGLLGASRKSYTSTLVEVYGALSAEHAAQRFSSALGTQLSASAQR